MSVFKGKGYVFDNVKILFALFASLIVIVMGSIALVLNAVVKNWPTQTTLGVTALAVVGAGLLVFIVLGLRILYHRLGWQVNENLKNREDAIEAAKKRKQAAENKNKRRTRTSGSSTQRTNILNAIRIDTQQMDEYYESSLDNLKYSFILAIVFCIGGLILFFILALSGFQSKNINVFVGIIGGISELFAGTAFLMYRSAQKQLYVYYEELHDNEMLLAAVEIAKTLVKEENREAAYTKIIDGVIKIMTDTPENLIADSEKTGSAPEEDNEKEGNKTVADGQSAAAGGATGKEELKRTVIPK